MTHWQVEPAAAVHGDIVVNGDKSISHRSLLIGAVCDGPVRVRGFGASADTLATLACVRALGVRVEEADAELVVHGVGLRGLREPVAALDVANSGTLMRLMPGLLAGQAAGRFVLDGDASIRRRPVERIAAPLRLMGADVTTTNGCPPLTVRAGAVLHGVEYVLPMASAQVKSCILLAGLNAEGQTAVLEPAPTRDHTERLLRAAGAQVSRSGSRVELTPPARLELDVIDVPADFSSAAFLIVAATLLPTSTLHLRGVGVNSGRTGLLTVLERMGARVGLFNRRVSGGGEPVADIEVRHAELVATEVEPDLVPATVDELPLVALAAACAHGVTRVRGAGELRLKESDRLQSVAEALQACGARITVVDDGWDVRGVPVRLRGGTVDPHGDHRIAMMAAIAAAHSENGVRILDPACVAVSFPEFRDLLQAVTVLPERA